MFYDFYINFCLFVVDVALSSDFMTGFCGETEEEHNDTISLLNLVEFDMAYMFAYSMRKVIYTILWNWFHDCFCSSYFFIFGIYSMLEVGGLTLYAYSNKKANWAIAV